MTTKTSKDFDHSLEYQRDMVKMLKEDNAKLRAALDGLLNKVNRVTCVWRHSATTNADDLDALSNRQIEVERAVLAKED